MAKSERQRIAEIIESRVAYFNGWRVEEATMKRDCDVAAVEILGYLRRRDSYLKSVASQEGKVGN